MFSSLLDVDMGVGNSLSNLFQQIAESLQYNIIFVIGLIIECFLVFLFVLRIVYSYEVRLKRSIDKANSWLFTNKKITQENIKEFNELIKKGPKRLVYYWQQFILYREHEPTYYMSLDNLVEKPLKTSGYLNNVRNLNISTFLWASISLLLSIACVSEGYSQLGVVLLGSCILPLFIIFIGIIASIILRERQTANMDEIYHIYHIFARFLNNACVDLPPYIDYDLLFTSKEIEKSNAQLREYYEARARKAKEEFEKAKQSDIEYVEYNFQDAGVDGSLVLERAMKESEAFMNKKSSTLAKIAHVDAQKEALKRNYENVQKDLQRKIQASKENIQKLIQQQEATTNRMEVGFLRKQQEQEINKQESLQTEYDQEETRFALSNEELDKEIQDLRKSLEQAKEDVQKSMVSEYQSFYEKIMKNAYATAEERVKKEKDALKKSNDANEKELILVQTQIKRYIDENNTLKSKIEELTPPKEEEKPQEEAPKGEYDANGNYVYENGSYHDPNGLFHDVDGKVYDSNGILISEPEDEQRVEKEQEVAPVEETLPVVEDVPVEEIVGTEEKQEETAADKKKRGRPRKPAKETQEQAEKRGRGRPKKQQAEKTEEKVEEVPQEPKVEEKAEEKQEKPKTTKPKSTTKKTGTAKKASKPKAEKPKTKKTKTQSKPKTKAAAKTTGIYSEKDGVPPQTQTASRSRKKPKEDIDLVSLAKINKMITDEEKKLSKMKALVNSEITDALAGNDEKQISQERDEIMAAVESLRQKAAEAQKEGKSEEELASINSRLESLIKEISELNKKGE